MHVFLWLSLLLLLYIVRNDENKDDQPLLFICSVKTFTDSILDTCRKQIYICIFIILDVDQATVQYQCRNRLSSLSGAHKSENDLAPFQYKDVVEQRNFPV